MNNIKFFRNLFLILFTSPIFSQLSSDECLEQLSIFAESAKIKNYQAAYEPWKTVLDNCPKLIFSKKYWRGRFFANTGMGLRELPDFRGPHYASS